MYHLTWFHFHWFFFPKYSYFIKGVFIKGRKALQEITETAFIHDNLQIKWNTYYKPYNITPFSSDQKDFQRTEIVFHPYPPTGPFNYTCKNDFPSRTILFDIESFNMYYVCAIWPVCRNQRAECPAKDVDVKDLDGIEGHTRGLHRVFSRVEWAERCHLAWATAFATAVIIRFRDGRISFPLVFAVGLSPL